MTKTVYLCEKPSQARDIARVLGAGIRKDGYIEGDDLQITWCFGHLLELAPPEHYCDNLKPWRMAVLPVIPKQWKMLPGKNRKAQLNIIKKLLKQTGHVVIATDADREGDVIGRELLDYFGFEGKTERLWLSALDDASIKKALADIRPGESTWPLYQAGLGRQRADWMIGMSMTMAASHLFGAPGQGALSVGRVQTPTLNLIVERDRRIEDFKPVDYFELDIVLAAEQGTFEARWKIPDALADSDGHCLSRQEVKAVANRIQGKTAVVTVFEDRLKKTAPPVCFSLSALQKTASGSLGLSAKKTLETVQSLYENHKATTYPRTDTGYLPVSQFSDAGDILNALAHIDPEMEAIVAQCDITRQSPIWNDSKVTAHHGIIPTCNMKVNIHAMNTDERAVYDLIRRQYIAQFLGEYEYHQRNVRVQCGDESFVADTHTPKVPGWKQAINTQPNTPNDCSNTIPELSPNQSVNIREVHIRDGKTRPPPRFTEGTLITAMKHIGKFVDDATHKKTLKATAGIGTEATRADTIEKLLNRGYLQRKKKKLISTARARELMSILPDQIKNPATTALWEQELDAIAQGNGCLSDFLLDQQEVLEFMLDDLQRIRKTRGRGIDMGSQYPCPECQSPMARRKGKNGHFWGCTRYPDCHGLMPDRNGKPGTAKNAETSDMDCPCCGSGKLIKRKGKKKGHWWGCNRYPDCKAIYWDKNGKPDPATPQKNLTTS